MLQTTMAMPDLVLFEGGAAVAVAVAVVVAASSPVH
jgi:hypothetical protein